MTESSKHAFSEHAPILVGVDGSESAMNAVRWAAREAVLRDAPLLLMHASLAIPVHPPVALPKSFRDALTEQGTEWLAEAARMAEQVAPEVEVAAELRSGFPAETMVSASRAARLVVLGSRGLGGFTGLLVGSISVTVAAHGHCPVVVVRHLATESEQGAEDGSVHKPVVVGVDGSPASDTAVDFAFEAAALRGVPLVALHTWSDHVVDVMWTVARRALDWDLIEADERRALTERLSGWQEKYPDVEVRPVVAKTRPANSLLQQSADAQLVVVGSRGRGGLRGMLLGSTSQAVLHHSACPVAVVRTTTRD